MGSPKSAKKPPGKKSSDKPSPKQRGSKAKSEKKSKPTDRRKNYLGAAGELRAASELSLRGYITHLPAVDEGGDLFAVDNDTLTWMRIQVKTCATPNQSQVKGHTSYQVGVRGSLLKKESKAFFVLHCIHAGEWWSFVFSRDELVELMPGDLPGDGKQKNIWIAFDEAGDVKLGGATGKSVKDKRDAWSTHFPVLRVTGLELKK